MITAFHGQRFKDEVDKMEIDEGIKESIRKGVNEFMTELFEMA